MTSTSSNVGSTATSSSSSSSSPSSNPSLSPSPSSSPSPSPSSSPSFSSLLSLHDWPSLYSLSVHLESISHCELSFGFPFELLILSEIFLVSLMGNPILAKIISKRIPKGIQTENSSPIAIGIKMAKCFEENHFEEFFQKAKEWKEQMGKWENINQNASLSSFPSPSSSSSSSSCLSSSSPVSFGFSEVKSLFHSLVSSVFHLSLRTLCHSFTQITTLEAKKLLGFHEKENDERFIQLCLIMKNQNWWKLENNNNIIKINKKEGNNNFNFHFTMEEGEGQGERQGSSPSPSPFLSPVSDLDSIAQIEKLSLYVTQLEEQN